MASFRLRKKKDDPEIDVGAFADIAFLLIIFFILTTNFLKPAGSKMKIPSGSADKSQKTEKQMTVNLEKGRILWGENQKVMKLDEFKNFLLEKQLNKQPEKERIIILDSGPDVSYELYYKVVMAITHADGVMALIVHEDQKKE